MIHTAHTQSTVHHKTRIKHSIPQHYSQGISNPSQWLKLCLHYEVSHLGHFYVSSTLQAKYDWLIHYLALSYILSYFTLCHTIHLTRQCTLRADYYALHSHSWLKFNVWDSEGKWTLLNCQDDSNLHRNLLSARIINHVTIDFTHKGIMLTNLLELLLRTVLAFPNASKSGFDSRMTSFICWTLFPPPETLAM